jgi:hypothetical protein
VRLWNYEILKKLIYQLYNQFWIDKITVEWIEEEQHYMFAKQLESDFKHLDFRYQWYYFNK